MAIEDELYRAFTGRTRDVQETPTDMLLEIFTEIGSGRATARYVGVAPSTLAGWLHGRHPRPASAAKIVAASRQFRMRDNQPTENTVVINTRDRNDGRPRTLTTDNLRLLPGTIERAREAYLRGDDVGAARAFLAGIGEPWYRQWLTPGSEAAHTGVPGGMIDQGYGRGPAERGAWVSAHGDQDEEEGAPAEDEEWVSVEGEDIEYEGYEPGIEDTDYGTNILSIG